MTAQYDVICQHIAQWEQHFVEPDVFETTDPQKIAEHIDSFCQAELGAAVEEYLFYEASIGAVCGVRLMDQRRIVVKVHHARPLAFLQAMVQVQHYLLAHGYPCPKPLLAPRPLAQGIATTEVLMDEGVYHEASDPAIRRSMAEMLARLIHFTKTPAAIPGVQPAALDVRLPPGVTWGVPHSKLFDFEATAAGAEWIDEIASHAQTLKLQGAGDLVLGHSDWGVKHFRYVGDRVSVIYDWDSLSLEKEPIIVGHASGYFTYTEYFGGSRAPTDEEAQAFIVEYEAARGKPFTPEEYQTMRAAKLYGLAYGARLEHALNPQEISYPEGSCCARLAQYT
ncbi:hypothetical protein KSF_005570 [Reticulibacter mediterranei]|uniref:Aminoglycoside phosphotransferase domain-containing protein n=1 Tax=Reticulibacter mediterranei TaxID=2778369 RepID=A0A8J3I7Y5_9CHLR|nr:phosphotransferase [Reticulibacter mediterranei]GHO90509.1 hypothetical protein KSF_005570 [Reticulibacter mediterranei]